MYQLAPRQIQGRTSTGHAGLPASPVPHLGSCVRPRPLSSSPPPPTPSLQQAALLRNCRNFDTEAPRPTHTHPDFLPSPLQLPTFLQSLSSQRPAPKPHAASHSSLLPSLSSASHQHSPRGSRGADLCLFRSEGSPPLTLQPSLATALGLSSPSVSDLQLALQFLTCHVHPASNVTLNLLQSDFGPHPSAETVLDRVISALLVAKSYGHFAGLISRDSSATFGLADSPAVKHSLPDSSSFLLTLPCLLDRVGLPAASHIRRPYFVLFPCSPRLH